MSKEKATIHPIFPNKADAEKSGAPFSSSFADDEDVCPICFGSGLEYVKDKGVKKCECRKLKNHSSLIEKAGIPSRYGNCHFHNYKPQNSSQERAFQFASKLALEFPAVERGLLLMGGVGVGKTHLAVSILKGLTERGFKCLFYEFGRLTREVQDTYSSASVFSELNILTPVLESEVLVLDEIGASKPTEWTRDFAAHIINTRYNKKKLTIFTTNYTDEPANPEEETLEDRVGTRIRSRLFEMSKTIVITGQDYRRRFDKTR